VIKNGRKQVAGVLCFLGLRLDGAGQRSRTKTIEYPSHVWQCPGRGLLLKNYCRQPPRLCTIKWKQQFCFKNKNSKQIINGENLYSKSINNSDIYIYMYIYISFKFILFLK